VKLGFGLPTKQDELKLYFLIIASASRASAWFEPKLKSQWLPSTIFQSFFMKAAVAEAGLNETQCSPAMEPFGALPETSMYVKDGCGLPTKQLWFILKFLMIASASLASA
jgi:hypothetical protein